MATVTHDVEKAEVNVTSQPAGGDVSPTSDTASEHDIPKTPVLLKGTFGKWNDRVEGLSGLEARGITRVLPEEKHAGGMRHYVQMVLLWFSINLVANNLITGLLGPLVFGLGWVDSVCIVIFATALASAGASYTATFGPESGNRTMVFTNPRCEIDPFADDVRCYRSLGGISWVTGRPN